MSTSHPFRSQPFLEIQLSLFDLEEALDTCENFLKTDRGGSFFFATAHSVVEAQKNPSVFNAFQSATLVLADGLPLVWFSRLLGKGVKGRACGPDFMHAALTRFITLPHGFIGGKSGQAEFIAKKWGLKYSSHLPPFRSFSEENAKEDWESFLKEWNLRFPTEKPKLVWVALGAPKQELWVQTVQKLASSVIFLPIGAAIDFHSDSIQRAPLWIQQIGLEWLHRLAGEPKRLFSRYLKTNTLFLFYIAKELFRRSLKF